MPTKKTKKPATHISEIEDGTCAFCKSSDVFIPEVGISFGMAGYDYSFCKKCLSGMTAEEFWHQLFLMHDYEYPPKLIATE
jgi:Pyruvate/2-oxoacid:ferredoxin oxidoreductase delta subunit